MSAANAGAASAITAAVPSKSLFMSVPLYYRDRHQSNNVASFWLLRDNAGAVIARYCDGIATTAFCSIGVVFFAGSTWFAAMPLSTNVRIRIQGSLKSDRRSL